MLNGNIYCLEFLDTDEDWKNNRVGAEVVVERISERLRGYLYHRNIHLSH